MNYRDFAIASACLTWFTIAGGSSFAIAEDANVSVDQSAVLAPFVNDDTFLVGYLDLSRAEQVDNLVKLLLQLPQQSPTDTMILHAVGSAVRGLQASGITGVYAVLGLGDLYHDGGPLVVVRLKAGTDQSAAENMLRGISQSLSAVNTSMPKFPVERRGPETLVIGSELTVARYKSLISAKRSDLTDSLATLAGEETTVAGVFSPGPDFRRVVRELWPPIPAPLAGLRGELADRWLRLEFAAKTSPAATASLTMTADDAKSAQQFVDLLRALPAASEQFTEISNKQLDLKRVLTTILGSVSIRVDGSRVEIALPTDQSQLAKLQGLIGEASAKAMESTYHRQRMQQFKQIALAVILYADKFKHLPPPAIRDKDGKPLLSWRVAILPYLEQNNLYKQFHLDEPWDSPHNLALAKIIPSIYADPAQSELAKQGKTTYVVPVAPGTVFDSKTGNTFREISDGTSNTIMIVELPAEDAVIWTQPADWQVDLAQPWHGIKRTDRDQVAAAWCDGHVSLIPQTCEPDKLRKVLTRAGGETVDWP